MSAEWNAERVLALAPDAASAKAGQGLAAAKKWASLGRGDGLVWGECQGSGKDPYQAKVDPDEPAFSCSCPSRKSPCKHALGLMLVWASGPGAIAETAAPSWVVSWKEGRAKRAEAKKEKAERPSPPADPAAHARREAARSAKVTAGLAELDLWLSDLLRGGFAALGSKPGRIWDEQARRMIDAQAPGIARRLRQIDAMPLAGDGWQASLLDRLGRIHLLTEGFRRRDALPVEVAEDLRTAIGFPADLDAARAAPGFRDHWQVIGHSFADEDHVVVRRTWLVGRHTNRPALLLDFAAGNRPLEPGNPPGTLLDADLGFLPGAVPLRAVLRERHGPPMPLDTIAGGTTIAGAFAAFGEALAKSPWLELYPVVLADVLLIERDGEWSLRDGAGATLPLAKGFARGWHLLALSGRGPLTITGEFDGQAVRAVGGLAGGRFLTLVTPQTGDASETSPFMASAIAPLLAEATASATVGVARKPPPPPADGAIVAALAGIEARDAPARLLAVAAATSLYARAGRRPAIDPSPAPSACPPEDQPECAPEVARRLRAMLGGEQVTVLPEWLALLAASGGRVPHDAIVDLLDRQPNPDLPIEPLLRGIGTRGRWLATKNVRWSEFAHLPDHADLLATWETGDRQGRLAAFRALLATDPSRAADLLAAGFKKEPADFRVAILDEYGPGPSASPGLTMAVEPLLEASLDDRSVHVRSHAAALLRKLPESRLGLRMSERAKALMSWGPGPSGRRGALLVHPPAGCDEAMARDGIPQKPGARGKLGQRGAWLHEVLAATPPAAIAAALGAPAPEIAAATRDHEWRDTLLDAWAVATFTHRDAEWAGALLDERIPEWIDTGSRPELARELCECLPGDRRNAYVAELLRNPRPLLASSHPAAALIGTLDRPVDPAIAREVIARLRLYVEAELGEFRSPKRRAGYGGSGPFFDSRYHDHATGAMIESLADLLPFDLADEAADGFDPGDRPHPYYAGSFAAMIERLKFRRDMHREFAP